VTIHQGQEEIAIASTSEHESRGSSEADTFNKKLVDALRESLTRILGEASTKAVLYFITRDFGIRLEELSDKVAELHGAFVKIFGTRATVLLENAIAKDFCEKLSLKYDPELTLLETVEKARKESLKQSIKARKN
jgi:hypothetical protein